MDDCRLFSFGIVKNYDIMIGNMKIEDLDIGFIIPLQKYNVE